MTQTPATANQVPMPSYLEQVEQVVGIRFLLDEHEAAIAYTNPAALSPETIATYSEMYIAGLHLLVAARREYGALPYELTWQQRRELRATHAEQIQSIQQQLTAVAPVVDTAPEGTVLPAALKKEKSLSQGMYSDIAAQVEPVQVTFKRSGKSAAGVLHLRGEDADKVRAAADALPVVTEDDVPVHGLWTTLHTDNQSFTATLTELGIAPRSLRLATTSGRMANYITREQLAVAEGYYASKEDNVGMQSILHMAERTSMDDQAVRKQIAWHGWDKHYKRRRQRNENGAYTHAFFLADEFADVIIAELSVIVPHEYLTIGEYAEMRGTNDISIRRDVAAHSLPTHSYQTRERSIAYLDGATMHKLDGILKLREKYVEAPEDWPTMRQLVAEFRVTDATIAKHMVGDYAEAARNMLPRGEGRKVAIPHYSPEFRAHLRTIIKPKAESLAGTHTSLGDIAERAGLPRNNMYSVMTDRGIPPVQVLSANGSVENYYPNDIVERILPTLPKRRLQYTDVTVETLVGLNGMKPWVVRTRLSRVDAKPAGRFYTDFENNPMSIANYYTKADAIAAGLRVPASPAFPAGERPYGNYGPAKATPLLEKPPSHAHQLLYNLLLDLPQGRRPTREAAVDFITAHGGTVQHYANNTYVLGVSAGLINYNFGHPSATPQEIGTGWLTRDQLAELTSQPVDVVDADLRRLDWAAVRKELVGIHVEGSGDTNPRDRGKVHVLWHKAKGASVVEPYYNPAIVSRIKELAAARHKTPEPTWPWPTITAPAD
ncbi:MAG TPA: hypothetical protein VLF62_02865 [Candidatus Saccharimonadales bacterium]|nr:hypothetical protein [Candidatus Saccharimonadales bacterium]